MNARILLAILSALVLAHAGVRIHLSAADLAVPVLAVVAAFGAGCVVLVRLIVADRRAGWRPEMRKGQPWLP